MNRVVHFEIHGTDMDKMQKFYSDVFGWDIKDYGPAMGGYRGIMTGTDAAGEKWPGINGGLTPRKGSMPQGGEPVNAYVCTISVEDVGAMIEKAKSAGATVALDVMDVPSVGKLVYMKDPEGNLFGMLQPEAQA